MNFTTSILCKNKTLRTNFLNLTCFYKHIIMRPSFRGKGQGSLRNEKRFQTVYKSQICCTILMSRFFNFVAQKYVNNLSKGGL